MDTRKQTHKTIGVFSRNWPGSWNKIFYFLVWKMSTSVRERRMAGQDKNDDDFSKKSPDNSARMATGIPHY